MQWWIIKVNTWRWNLPYPTHCFLMGMPVIYDLLIKASWWRKDAVRGRQEKVSRSLWALNFYSGARNTDLKGYLSEPGETWRYLLIFLTYYFQIWLEKLGFPARNFWLGCKYVFSPNIDICSHLFCPWQPRLLQNAIFLLLTYRRMYQYFGKMKMLEPLGLEVINGDCLGWDNYKRVAIIVENPG